MAVKRPNTNLKLRQIVLDEETLAAMACLIMAFAEIEDTLTLAIMKSLNLGEHQVHTLVGTVGLSKRISIAVNALQDVDPEASETIKSTFKGENWIIAKNMRDCVAHGLLLGTNTGEHLAFRLSNNFVGENGPLFSVQSFKIEQFKKAAADAEIFVKSLRKALDVTMIHEMRLQYDLVPRPKPQKK